VRITTLLNREFLTLFLAFLVIASAVAWVVENPPANEDFASISVLGPRMDASVYFPNNDTTVTKNEPIQWYVQVYNHEKDLQLFSVYVLLANLTTTSPNATSNTPSGGTLLAHYYRAMEKDETWTIPLSWSITNETTVSGTTTIKNVMINSKIVNGTNISALPTVTVPPLRFRMVIELWSYSAESQSYIFSFISNGSLDSQFNQIWFNS
jgi:hypothetical protein